MSIKLIASDIDGTLIGKSGKLSERTVSAFKECEKRGIKIVLASGRNVHGASEVAIGAGLDCCIISANGGRADLSPMGECVFEDFIQPELSVRIHDELRRAGCFMTSYVGKYVYRLDETNGYGSACSERSEAVRTPYFAIVNDIERMRNEGTVNPYKYEAYSDDTELLNTLRGKFLSWGLSVTSAFPCNLEIMSSGGGKGRALAALSRQLGVSSSEIMAFGDGTNDLSMLEFAGYPVAMSNGVDALKSVSWRVAPDCDDSGVAQIIEKYVLSGELI